MFYIVLLLPKYQYFTNNKALSRSTKSQKTCNVTINYRIIKLYMSPPVFPFICTILRVSEIEDITNNILQVSTTQFNIVNKLQIMRQEYERITAELMNINGSVIIIKELTYV